MSGGGAGSGYTSQRNTSTSEAGPPTPIAWALNDIAGRRMGEFQNNPNAPAYYPGATVAGFSPQSESALTGLFNRGAGSPLTAAGKGLAGSTLGGDFLNLSKNPYLQGAISYAQQPVIDAFNSQVLPGINSTFGGSGRTGSGLHQAAVGQAVDSLGRNLAGAATQAGANAYAQERGNQMGVLGMLPSFQAGDYQDINAQLQAGGMRDAKAQQLIDADIQRYNYDQNAQGEYLTRVAQQLQSIYPGGSSSGTGQSYGMQPVPTTSPWGPILGGLGLAGSLMSPAGPFAAGGMLAGLKGLF